MSLSKVHPLSSVNRLSQAGDIPVVRSSAIGDGSGPREAFAGMVEGPSRHFLNIENVEDSRSARSFESSDIDPTGEAIFELTQINIRLSLEKLEENEWSFSDEVLNELQTSRSWHCCGDKKGQSFENDLLVDRLWPLFKRMDDGSRDAFLGARLEISTYVKSGKFKSLSEGLAYVVQKSGTVNGFSSDENAVLECFRMFVWSTAIEMDNELRLGLPDT
jgi:hypothetical protein